jgi:hypothetical protein
MKKIFTLSGVLGSVLVCGTFVCHAEKWDRNDYTDATIKAGYYAADSIKVKGNVVSWTEKYILTDDGAAFVDTELSKHQICRENIAKKGKVTQFQQDYQIEKSTLRFRNVAKRYYDMNNKLICTSKDTGTGSKTEWSKILRGSPMQQTQYDLVTKYKIKIQ